MNKMNLQGLRELRPATPEGRAARKNALEYLERLKTPDDLLKALKAIGLYEEDGKPNPYFYPEAEDAKAGE